MTSANILHFWFIETDKKNWFSKSDGFDELLRVRFGQTLEQASRGELYHWRNSAEGRLAEIIVLDQFSRNIFRDSPKAFSQDTLALVLAQEMVAQRLDNQLDDLQIAFCYMPFMHSESSLIQSQSVELFSSPRTQSNLSFAIRHKDIIDEFGRYPHRNQVLGRESSEAELAFLQTPGSSF